MRTHLLPFTFATCSLIGLGACTSASDDDSTAKTHEDYEDMAQAIGSSLASSGGGDTAAFGDATSVSLGVLPFGFSIDGSGQIGGARFGLSYRYGVTCHATGGEVMSVCDATTDHAEIDSELSGSIDLPRFSAAVERSAMWRLAGLQTDVVTLDGDGGFAYDSTVVPAGRPERTYELDVAASYDGVLIRRPDHRAIGGSISYQIEAERTVAGEVEASFEMDAVVVFQANGDAIVTLDGEAGFRIDSVTGNVSDL